MTDLNIDPKEKERINRVLARWMGVCYHTEWEISGQYYYCVDCHIWSKEKIHPDYFPPSPTFWKLLERATQDESWKEFRDCFCRKAYREGDNFRDLFDRTIDLIGPRFLIEWAKWVGKE